MRSEFTGQEWLEKPNISTAIHVFDVVEAHCYFVDIGQTDCEQIHSRINNNDCRTFASAAYKTTYLLTISSPDTCLYQWHNTNTRCELTKIH